MLRRLVDTPPDFPDTDAGRAAEQGTQPAGKTGPIMTLNQLHSGQSGTVRRVSGEGAIRRRLMDMGLVRGARVDVVKAAPLGDPVEYRLYGYHLSLRRSEAGLVEVELAQGSDE